MKHLAIICATIMLAGCTATKPVSTTGDHFVYINGKVYEVHDGTSITFRDPKTGQYVPLTVEK